ncbi:MAG: RpiB/LacA/LacB family sugar-phosphate isomerase, partial [Eggerthella lenta]
VTSPLFAALAREHNDANVVAVSGRFVDESVNREILDAFVSTSFGGGRHAGRVEKIAALENE